MRKTVSSDYNVFARAAGKIVYWKVSIKKTASLSESQSTGTWIDVTDYISPKSFPKMNDKAELAYGQFSSQTITLIGLDIPYWKGTFFNYANYLEVKIEFWINNLTGDTLVMFAGWVDKVKGEFKTRSNERSNSITFSCYNYQELGNRMSAADILVQPINDDVDGAGTPGLSLQGIPGVFVTNANVSTFVLKKGFHRLIYQYNGGSPQIQLDDGSFTSLTVSGNYTLANNDVTQKITLRVNTTVLPGSDVSQGIVVKVEGDTIPKTWYQRVSILILLKELYKKIGITDYFVDDFQLATYDARNVTSYFDIPPGDSFYKKPHSLAFDASNYYLWIGIGDKIFLRDLVDNTYTEIGQITGGYKIVRFFTEQVASDKIWGIAQGNTISTAGKWKIFRVTPSTGNLSSWLLANRITNGTWPQNFAFANNYGTAGIIYFIATTSPYNIWYFNLDSLTEVDTGIALATQGQYNLAGWSDGTDYFCQRIDVPHGPNASYVVRVYDSGGGVWVSETKNGGGVGDYVTDILDGAFNPTESVSICGNVAGGVLTYNHSTGYLTLITNSTNPGNFSYSSGKVYYSREYPGDPSILYIDYVDAGTDTTLAGNIIAPELFDSVARPNQIVYDSVESRILGIFDRTYLLFQLCTKSSMYTEIEANFEGKNVFDAIKELCLGFNLRPRISATKKAYVFRRGDDTGAIVTSGAVVTLNADTARDITEETGSEDAYDIVTVSNGILQESINADGFGAIVFAGEREQKIENKYIQKNLIKDAAYRFFQYFKNSHTRYVVPTPLIPFFQHEPYDGASLSFSGKINTTSSGIMIGHGIDQNGRTDFDVIV